ncbi:MAG TPA: efflux RND transporter periplasmic adaptor subunit [Kofleriaceae bacterium]|nr:efflux RND transporter periplasmic adaptor subunit [Kofleriaceae bacterium]
MTNETSTSTTTPSAMPTEFGAAILQHQPKRRAGIIAAVLVAGGAGVLAGMQLRGSPGSSTASGTGGAAGMADMPGMSHDGPPAPPGAGSQAVYISPARQQLVGVRSAPIARKQLEGTIRTVGMLAYDETRSAQIHTRVAGWVEQLYVDYVGKPVRRGQALFAVYSPDLATAQGDYLVALRARQKIADNTNPDLRAGADALLAASRDRMRRWNVTDAQIAELERSGSPGRTVTIASPFDGVVLEKEAFAGQYVTPEMTSFKLADLSSVWAVGQVFEYEAARLRIGDKVEVEFPYGQASKREATIAFIYPEVDPQKRRVRFRVSLDNRDAKLKPDTYVNLIWHGARTDRLVIPKEAVIDTGPRKYTLLALANGYFAPRDVQVGPAIGEFYPVISGVAEGDRVVTSAQFLVDSETNLMAAMQSMSMSMPGMDMGGMDMSKPMPKASGSNAAMPGMDMAGMDMSKPGAMDHSHHMHSGSAAGAGSAAMPGMPGM